MNITIRFLTTLLLLASAPLFAQPIVYPAQGQSQEQQTRDEGECHSWAVGNTGVDPAVLASTSAQQQSKLAQQAAQQQQAAAGNQKEQMDIYYRAYSACLTGRGYTLN